MMPPSRQAYVEQLARTHGFTLEALMANRARQIHPSQIARGRSQGSGWVVFFFILSALLLIGGVGGAIVLYDDMRPPVSDVDMNAVYALAGGGLLLSAGFVAIAIATIAGIKKRRRIYSGGALECIEGPIGKAHIRLSRGNDIHRYLIGGRTFDVPRSGWELVTHGAHYRVFTVAGDLLSIEPM
jgi:hypothetical protein